MDDILWTLGSEYPCLLTRAKMGQKSELTSDPFRRWAIFFGLCVFLLSLTQYPFTGTKPKKVDTHGTEESESITRADLAQALKSVQGGGGGSGGTGGAGGSGGGGRGRGRGKARASTSRGGRGSRARSKKKKGSSEYGAVATSAKAKAEKTCQAFNSGACSLRNCSKGTHK